MVFGRANLNFDTALPSDRGDLHVVGVVEVRYHGSAWLRLSRTLTQDHESRGVAVGTVAVVIVVYSGGGQGGHEGCRDQGPRMRWSVKL